MGKHRGNTARERRSTGTTVTRKAFGRPKARCVPQEALVFEQTLRNSVCRLSRVTVLLRALRVGDTHE